MIEYDDPTDEASTADGYSLYEPLTPGGEVGSDDVGIHKLQDEERAQNGNRLRCVDESCDRHTINFSLRANPDGWEILSDSYTVNPVTGEAEQPAVCPEHSDVTQ